MSSRTPLILASASPRRRELLAHLGIPFTVHPSTQDEIVPVGLTEPEEIAQALARQKAQDIASQHPDATVLAADTVVVLNRQILGKPADAAEARSMLNDLRGRAHAVITGVAVAYEGELLVDHASTQVEMRAYGDGEIERYIASGEPFDKAGGYAIQDPAFQPAEGCTGCYCNVVGLPIALTQSMLERVGIDVTDAQLPSQCNTCPFAMEKFR